MPDKASDAAAMASAHKALDSANKFQASAGGPLHKSAPYSAVAASRGVKSADPAPSDTAKEAGNLGKELDSRRTMEDAARTQ